MVQLDVERVQTSCGYAVPNLVFRAERSGLDAWAEKKGPDGLVAYRAEHNKVSIDGLPSGFVEPGGRGLAQRQSSGPGGGVGGCREARGGRSEAVQKWPLCPLSTWRSCTVAGSRPTIIRAFTP